MAKISREYKSRVVRVTQEFHNKPVQPQSSQLPPRLISLEDKTIVFFRFSDFLHVSKMLDHFALEFIQMKFNYQMDFEDLN